MSLVEFQFMLKQLQVQNYALIESLTLELDTALTAITGETGAGKSILLGALGHILGQRADLKSLRNTSEKCVIEAEFNVRSYELQSFFESNDLDYADSTILRREILPSGKSRAFVNDTPVQLQQMKQLGERLVDIHSQHQTLLLKEQFFQLELIDAYAKNHKEKSQYTEVFNRFKKIQRELEKKKQDRDRLIQDQAYFKFQLQEFDTIDLEEVDESELEQELSTLNHAEEIKSVLFDGTNRLNGEELSILSQLKQMLQNTQKIGSYGNKYANLFERLNSSKIELEDLALEFDQLQGEIEYDPARIQYLTDLQNKIYSLQQKHLVNTIEDLKAVQSDLEQKVDSVDHLDETISSLESQVKKQEEALAAAAKALSKKRVAVFESFQGEIKSLLDQLGMPHAGLEVHRSAQEPDPTGIDFIEFYFSANKGGRLLPIGNVASGGELSRLMLCLKLILSRLKKLPTLIFDEIDTGVSGNIAAKIADLMREMGEQMQVITITHLPQVAARGQHHVKVYKDSEKEQTTTHLTVLNENERVEELAKMLSGDEPSDAARLNAKELLAGNA